MLRTADRGEAVSYLPGLGQAAAYRRRT